MINKQLFKYILALISVKQYHFNCIKYLMSYFDFNSEV